MYTHEIKTITRDLSALKVEVIFTSNNGSQYIRSYSVDNLESLKQCIANELVRLEKLEVFEAELHIGPIDITPIPPTLDADTQARISYINDVELVRQCEKAIEAKLMKTDDQKYLDCITRLKANYKDEYLDILGNK